MKKYSNYFFNLNSSFFYLISQVLLLLYFNKIIGLEFSGAYTLSLSCIAPVFMFFNMQLKWLVATDIIKTFLRTDYLYFRLFTSIVSIIFIFFIKFIFFYKIDNILFYGVCLIKFLESISDIFYGFMQQEKAFSKTNKFLFLKSLFILIFIYFDYIFLHNYISLLFNISLIYFGFILLEMKSLKLFFNFNDLNIKSIVPLIKKNWHFGLVSSINSFKVNIPRYFIQNLGLSKLAVFSTINYLNYGMNFAFASLGEVSNVEISSNSLKLKKAIYAFFSMAFIYTFFLLIIIYFFNQTIVNLLIGNNIKLEFSLFFYIMINGLIMSLVQIIQNYFMVYRYSKSLLTLNIVEIVFLLLIYLIFHFHKLEDFLFCQTIISFIILIISIYILHLKRTNELKS